MTLRQIYTSALAEAERNGLAQSSVPARAHAWATWVLAYNNFTEPQRPDIISGFRSPQHQARLLQRWNSGDRVGLVAKPACTSWHTVGRAIDVQTDVASFPLYALLLRKTGARDGRDFSNPDPGHFDWPSSQSPPNICQQYT